MIYYAGWLYVVAISLIFSIAALVWGIRNGQFSDQDRARFFALGHDCLKEPVETASSRKQKLQNGVLLGIISMALIVFATALAMSIFRR